MRTDELKHYDEDTLVHFGVKGMKWGVRKSRPDGVSRSTNRQARKDAKEFTQAKQFYGDGAGTRRKLIKKTVEQRSKDETYKKAFDHHVENTDWSKRSSQAISRRKRTDTVEGAKKTTRGITHLVAGNPQYASAAAILLFGAAGAAYKAGVHKHVAKYGKTAYSKAKVEFRAQQIKRQFKQNGFKI